MYEECRPNAAFSPSSDSSVLSLSVLFSALFSAGFPRSEAQTLGAVFFGPLITLLIDWSYLHAALTLSACHKGGGDGGDFEGNVRDLGRSLEQRGGFVISICLCGVQLFRA